MSRIEPSRVRGTTPACFLKLLILRHGLLRSERGNTAS
jgi:hypothetical protein